ncbi:MAG: hypothetical protein HYX68_08210 [Planctomycetes bacterium]|nr:hypothetical protein [Planctomycetota bacterium]
MGRVSPLVDRLAPDTINRLERAAEMRHHDALHLLPSGRGLSAVYLFGYSVEMCLAAAYYRGVGFSPNMPIDRDARQRFMAQARRPQAGTGRPLMDSDPHPLVGWARFLESQRLARGNLSVHEAQRLQEAINKAALVYKHWRPELRYKTIDVSQVQVAEVRKASAWFIQQRGRL